nr:hypothetical protein HK105_007126 [Polyrhizophydium stewartii]
MPALARTTRLFASTPTALDKVSQSLPGVGLKASTDRMIIGFTCKVCGQRSHKSMSKKAYTSGVVIIKCDGCKNMHLIADHLGWFDSMNPPGTIEDILRAKGETVKRVEVPQPLRFKVAPSAAEASPDAAAALSQMGVDADGMLEWLPKAIADAEADMNLGKDKQ